jgi:drug/metabolite transporter (DMT)-like permease
MSLAIGRFILKEHLTRAKIFAAVIMAGGIFLLA